MASDLQKLRETINGVSSQSKKMSEGLARFKADFGKSKSRVSAVLAGSTKNTDKKVVQAIDAADKAVAEAQLKLQEAGKIAADYAREL